MKRFRFSTRSRTRARLRARLMAYVSLAVALLLVLLLSAPTGIFSAPPLDPTAVDEVNDAWQQALEIGVYDYSSDIVQTTWPTPRLENVGLSSTQRRFYLEGNTDLHEDFLQMALWSDGGNVRGRDNALEIKIEDGKSLGRVGKQAWEEVESDGITDLFAPGNDTLAYLSAMKDVVKAGEETRAGITFTRYTFEVDGPAFAKYMRNQMEQEMRRSGELPSSLNLDVARQYVEMTGAGEIWIGTNGLPLRQIVDLEFPPEKGAMEYYEAQITTDYSNWGEVKSSFFGLPALVQKIDWQQTGTSFGLLAGLMGLMTLMVLHGENKKLYHAFVMAVIISMVVGPLLSSHQVYAFSERQATKAREHEQQREVQQARAEVEAELAKDPFDPSVDPLVKGRVERELRAVSASEEVLDPLELKARFEKRRREVEERRLTTTTSQGDDTSDSDTDSDGDGLTDDIEVLELDLNHNEIDTDGDFISDKAEVEGFQDENGTQWYLDPKNADSNGDGRLDGQECANLVDVEVDGETSTLVEPTGTVCEDTDGDGTPDVYDFDDDDDRVPDAVDAAPTIYLGGDRDADNYPTGFTEQILDFKVDDVSAEYPLLVDIELRPTNPDHLWYSTNVLDWPSDDRDGQIKRVHDTTFGDSGSSANGDLRLTPLLEIEIPYQEGHYGNLPVIEGAPSITPDMSLDEWLDWDKVEAYGMSVRKKDDDGTLLVYAPLSVIQEESGDTPQAFGGRIYYQPNDDNFGDAHQMRLVWQINAIMDTCSPPDDEDFDTYCEDTDNWQSYTDVVHTYYEDWYVTGLSVQEEQGVDVAIISSNVAEGYDESSLWHVADGLQRSFLQARDSDGDGERDLTISEIEARFDVDSTASDSERWGITDKNTLRVDRYQFDEPSELATIPMTITKELLNERYPEPADGDAMTLLFVREQHFRTTYLNGDSSISDNLLTIDMGSQGTHVQAAMNWAPFKYDESNESDELVSPWDGYDIDEYWEVMGEEFESILGKHYDEGELEGSIVLAKSYYLSLYQGSTSFLEMDDTLLETADSSDDDELDDDDPVEAWAEITQDLVEIIAIDYLISSEKVANSNTLINSNENNIEKTAYIDVDDLDDLATDIAGVVPDILNTLGVINDAQSSSLSALHGTLSTISEHIAESNGRLSDIVTSNKVKSAGAIGALTAVGTLSVLSFTLGEDSEEWMDATMSSISFALEAYETVQEINKLVKKAGGIKKAFNIANQVTDQIKMGAVFGLVLEIAVAVGLFLYQVISEGIAVGSLAFNALLATLVATIIVSVIFFALSLIVPIGTILVALIGLIDGAISLFCEYVLDEDTQENAFFSNFCNGISGNLATLVGFFIYDQTPLADLDADDRMNPHNFDQSFEDSDLGLSEGANLTLSADVTTNLYMNDPDGLSHFSPYFKNYYLRQSTFQYELQSSEEDIHDALSKGETNWESLNDGTLRGTVTQTSEGIEIPLSQAGINAQATQLNLAEGYAINTSECFLLPISIFPPFAIPYCHLRDEKDSIHTDLGESLATFDVFPASLTEFHALEHVSDSSYKLTWDERFPVLADADGDGLRSQAKGGNDPNDADGDHDSDGLSDYWEVENGYDPSRADGDGDGLNDYWERFYDTDAYQADTDNDGLLDGEEVFHEESDGWTGGWDFFYADNSKTLVTSDPLTPDTDGDGITDKLEYVYGFHPRVPSELNVLAIESEISNPDSTNPHVAAPGHTLTYEATIENLTNSRYALGLFEAEFEAGSQEIEEQVYTLDPNAETTMSGSVTVDADITDSQSAIITTRAGANISDSREESYTDIKPLVYAKLDGNGEDSSGNDYDFNLADDQEPSIKSSGGVLGGYAYFDGGTALVSSSNDDALDLDDTDYTFALWLRQGENDDDLWHHVLGGTNRPTLFVKERQVGIGFGQYDEPCKVTSDENVLNSSDSSEWTHVAVVYGPPTNRQAEEWLDSNGYDYSFYINGQLEDSGHEDTSACNNSDNPGVLRVGRSTQKAWVEVGNIIVIEHDDDNHEDPNRHSTGEIEIFFDDEIKERYRRSGIDDGDAFDANFREEMYGSLHFKLCEDDNGNVHCSTSNNGNDDSNLIDTTLRYYNEFEEIQKEKSEGDNKIKITWSLANHYYEGDMDELLIYDQALTGDEIETLYEDYDRVLEVAFDEAPGFTEFQDTSGNNEHVDCADTRCPDTGLLGRSNQAIRLDGTREYVGTAMDVSEEAYTASLWFKTDCTDCAIFSVDLGVRGQQGHDRNIYLDDGDVCARIEHSSDDEQIICTSGTNYADEQWHHVIHTMNGDDEQRIYMDGEKKVSGDEGASSFTSQNGINIGYSRNTSDYDYFRGLLDHVVILDRYIADNSEAAELMQEVPVLNLHLDEELGETTFEDDSNYNNDATCSGDACPDAGVVGRMREGLFFDGVDDLITIPDNDALDLDRFSIGLWIKPTQVENERHYLLSKQSTSSSRDTNYAFYVDEDYYIHSIIDKTCGSGGGERASSNSTILENQWNHVMTTYDGTELVIYINGSQDETISATSDSLCDHSEPLYIGGRGTDDYFTGHIDELAIYSSALDDSEVKALYDYQIEWFDTDFEQLIVIDADEPSVSLELSTSHIALSDTVMLITANDLTSNIETVEYSIDGGSSWQTPTQDNEVWLFTYQPSAEGEQTIRVRATDSVGHETSNSTSFTVDGTVPAVTLDGSLTANTQLADQALELFGTATDESSGVNQVYVEIRESSGDTVNGPDLATLEDDSWTINFPLVVPLFGSYTVVVKASDEVGNINEQEYTLALDGQAPRADITDTGTYTSTLSGIGDDLPTVRGTLADIPSPNNPILHLHFEEESGSQEFNDGSGNFQNGTCEEGTCPSLDANGKHGQALAFEGDQVEVSLLENYSLHQSFTVGAWVKPIRQANSQYLLRKGSSNQTFALMMGDDSTQIDLTTLASDCSTVESVSSLTELSENEWSHLMATFNGESLILYINGVEDVRLDDLSDDRCENSEPLTLATLSQSLAYQGSLDEVLIYGRALSADEVDRIANPVTNTISEAQLSWRHAKGSNLNDALVLNLPFEEASGSSTFRDISTNRLLATCEEDTSCPLAGETGQIGQAARFDGSDDSLTIAQSARIDGQESDEVTVAAWVNPSTLSGIRNIVSSARTNSSNGIRFALQDEGLRFTNHGVKGYQSTQIALTTDEWTHVAAVLDAGHDVTFYVNGVAEETISHSEPGNANTDDDFLIGSSTRDGENSTREFFDGLLDEVRIYHRALSADEIDALFEIDGDSVTLAEAADYTTWSHQLPANIEGPHRLDMRTIDELGNIRAEGMLWQGDIDTLAPRVTLEVEDLGGTFRYTTTATDYNLTEDDFNSPCGFEEIDDSEYFSEEWYTEVFEDIDKLYQVSVSCESATQLDEEATACDLFGNCTTVTESSTTAIRSADWQASPAYLLAVSDSLANSAIVSETLLVDGQAPVITLDQSVITSTTYSQAGIIKLTGTASDTSGIDDVAVTIAPMQGSLLDVRLEGENWSVPWATNRIANPPDGESYTITVVATDLTGEQGELTQAVTIDAQAPTSVDVSVSYIDSQGTSQPLLAGMTIDDRVQPTLTAEWSASSDGSGLESYLVEWFNEETGEVYASEEVTEPRQASFTAAEAQKVSVRIISRDSYANQTTDTAGPFYADYVTTPVLNLWNEWGEPYQGWRDNSCNLIGTDYRLSDKASALASLNGEQNFYTAWNSEGLRLAWTGADWEQNGDLFIYVDSQDGGSENAYNPYPATEDDTIIQLPVYVEENEQSNQLEADYLVWVQENDELIVSTVMISETQDDGSIIQVPVTLTETNRLTATLMTWDEPSESWQASASPWRYAFSKGKESTDIYLPFSAIGINGSPASASLKMVALASEEEALKLWTTLPNNNIINSEKVFDIESDAQQLFALTTSYEWPSLGADICPSGFLTDANTRTVQRSDTLQPTGAEVELSITMEGGGISYRLLGDNLMTTQQHLLPNHANWDPMLEQLCQAQPMHPDCQRPPEEEDNGDLSLDPQKDLPKVMNTTHAALGDGQTISHTLHLVNHGAIDAEGVTIILSTRGRITLPDGEIMNSGPPGPEPSPESYTQLINVGTIPAGGERKITVNAVTDFDFDPVHDPKWAKILGVAYDDRGNEMKNQIELFYMDYELDPEGPRRLRIQSPVAIVAPGINTITGIVNDRSPVPTIILEVGLPDGSTSQTTCTDSQPANPIWTCDVDLGAVVEGETITIRAKGIDEHGNESEWLDEQSFRVDGEAPTITLSDESTNALNTGLIGPAYSVLTGVLTDNRLVSDVEVCRATEKGTSICTLANVELNQESLPETLYLYDDRPSGGVAIDGTKACLDNNPLVRTFTVTDTFSVANVELGLNIEHSYRNDMEVYLRAPSGKDVILITKANNNSNFDLLLSDNALSDVNSDENAHNIAAPYYENQRYAHGPLALFNGEEANGVWELSICDRYPPENEGTYHHARLFLTAERTPENTNATWSYSLPVDSDEYNQQSLTITALDSMGNRSEPINLNFTVDTTPPTIQATIPSTTSKLYHEVDLSGEAEDASGIASLQLHIIDPDNEISTENISLTNSSTDNERSAQHKTIEGLDNQLFLPLVAGGSGSISTLDGTWTYTNTNPFSKVGTHQVWLEGEDNAGNSSRIGPFELNVTAVEEVYLPIMSYFPPDFIPTPDAPDLGMGGDTVITDTAGGTEIQIFNIGSITITEPFRVDLYFDPTDVPTTTQSWDTLSEYGGYWIIDQPILAGDYITFTLESPFYQASGSNYPTSLEGLSEYYIQLDTLNDVLETHDIEPRLDNHNISRSSWLPDPEDDEEERRKPDVPTLDGR